MIQASYVYIKVLTIHKVPCQFLKGSSYGGVTRIWNSLLPLPQLDYSLLERLLLWALHTTLLCGCMELSKNFQMVLACAFGSGFDKISAWFGPQACRPCCWHSRMHNAPNERCRTMSTSFPHAILHTYITSQMVIGTSGMVQRVAPVLSFTGSNHWTLLKARSGSHMHNMCRQVHIFREWAQRWCKVIYLRRFQREAFKCLQFVPTICEWHMLVWW